MRWLFYSIFAALLLASGAAWIVSPRAVHQGRTILTWISDDNPARRDQVALFNTLHPQYELRLDPGNNGADKVLVQSLSGVGPDIFDCYSTGQLQTYVDAGVAWDITDELTRRGITPDQTWPLAYTSFMIGDRVYGWPDNIGANGLWYHKDLFDQAGVPYPPRTMTWATLVELAQKLTVRRNGRIVQYGMLGDGSLPLEFMTTNGGRTFDATGRTCVLHSPENIEAVQFWLDLMYRYEVMPSPLAEATMATQGGWGSGTITLFGDKRGAMAVGGRWWLSTLRAYKGLQLGVSEVPYQRVDHVRGGARAALINRHSPRREQALAFILHLAGEPYSRAINDQADAFGPMRRLASTPEFLLNPQFPAETYNAVWAAILEKAEPYETTPHADLDQASLILNLQLDLVKSRLKTPDAALRDAEAEINRAMRKRTP
jgi:multiple sugar transport system substrate-binding protein